MTERSSGAQLPEIDASPPGPASRSLARRLRSAESRGVTFMSEDFPVFWERARGSNVWDADGNRYVDLTAGFAVAAAGHGHPRIREALRGQADRLVHGMGDVHPPAIKTELLEKLAEFAPQPEPRIVLGTSGSEAVEIALKTATLHTGRPGFIAFTGAYHGLSYGALSVTDRAHFRSPFEAQLSSHVLRAGYPHPYRPPQRLGERPNDLLESCLRDLELLLGEEAGARVGAVVLEPIQGRGGEVVPPPGFVRRVADLCRERDLLLIADEVYTGFGRTGYPFACDAEEVMPDLLCVGKALSGGMPISACIGRREVMEAWPASEGEAIHTSTFLGHPLACAAAVASLAVFGEEELAARARDVGERWIGSLRHMAAAHASVGDVRGRGLMVGLELVAGRDSDAESESGAGRDAGADRKRRAPAPAPDLARRVVRESLRRGWILLAGGPEGNVLSLTPPLTIDETLLESSVEMLDEVLDAAAAELSGANAAD